MKNLTFLIIALLFIQITAFSQPCLPEGIIFTSQVQIDSFQINYPNCTEIEGYVTISGDDINNLNGLSVLTLIGGDFELGNYDGGNPALTSLSGLEGITSIGGNLEIKGNVLLSGLTGLANVDTIGGGLVIKGNTALTSLTGLENLTSIGTDIYGILRIENNSNLTSLTGLDNINFIAGELSIDKNAALTSLTGLENVTSIGEGIIIWDNDNLTSLSALENLYSIGGYLRIQENDALSSLTGLDNIEAGTITGLLFINYNTLLTNCEVQSVCDYLANPNGTIQIYYNAPGCNNPIEVQEACDEASVDELYLLHKLSVHPNPFTTSTTIEYELKQPEIVQITIYNHLGKQIEKIIKNQSQWKQKVLWNTKKLPPGVYFCVLQTNEGIRTTKMIKL